LNGHRTRRCQGERGASLILAIAFMLVIAGIGAAVVSSVTTGLNSRNVLDQVRNRQYAADGGIEYAIARVRAMPLPTGPGFSDCGDPALTPPPAPADHYNHTLNGINIRVDCANKSDIIITPGNPAGLVQRNVIFTACVDTGTPCTSTNTIIRAQVNYEGKTAITRTWVQSWSVNR
jgi:Tfp pilus assembly protein PilX